MSPARAAARSSSSPLRNGCGTESSAASGVSGIGFAADEAAADRAPGLVGQGRAGRVAARRSAACWGGAPAW